MAESHNAEQNMPSLDRLSDLPDDVLCHILSFLPTKRSVSTSILSRRWRFLWTEVPILKLTWYTYGDRNPRFDHLDEDHYADNYVGHLSRFLDIVNTTLARYKVNAMDNFCLSFPSETFEGSLINEPLKACIPIVIACKVRGIGIYQNYFSDPLIVLPQCLFTCKTLVSLSLDSCEIPILLYETVCYLPNLKKLILCDVFFNGDANFCRLISCCPVLEYLYVQHRDVHHGIISSPTLKWLEVEFPEGRLELNAPALRYLRLNYCSHVSVEALNSLIEANITVEFHDGYAGYLLELFDGLCNVKCLELTIYNDLQQILGSTFTFYNLSKLGLNADWRLIPKFLESAVNLQDLYIGNDVRGEIVVDQDDGIGWHNLDLKVWREPQVVPTCLLSHLRTIKIAGFECSDQYFEMVKYLLRNGRVLKTMEINFVYYRWTELKTEEVEFIMSDTSDKILQFERGSEECEMIFDAF